MSGEAKTPDKVKLNENHRFLLTKLIEGDFTPYGSCKGRTFDELLDLGFVQLLGPTSARGIEYNLVTVTPSGRSALQGGAND